MWAVELAVLKGLMLEKKKVVLWVVVTVAALVD